MYVFAELFEEWRSPFGGFVWLTLAINELSLVGWRRRAAGPEV